MFEPLTKFIEPLKEPDKLGTWRSERYDEKGNIVELVIPYIDYCGGFSAISYAQIYGYVKGKRRILGRRHDETFGRAAFGGQDGALLADGLGERRVFLHGNHRRIHKRRACEQVVGAA